MTVSLNRFNLSKGGVIEMLRTVADGLEFGTLKLSEIKVEVTPTADSAVTNIRLSVLSNE